LKQYDGWWVSFETLRENYTIKRADMISCASISVAQANDST
jgi:hypothetical protein